MTSSVMIPPALRMMWASPLPRPRIWKMSMRESMHATTARLRVGATWRSPSSKTPAYSAFLVSSSSVLGEKASVMASEARWAPGPSSRADSSAMGPADVVAALQDALPAESVVVDPDVVDGYRFDRAKTVVPGMPVALVRAGSTAEVAATLRVASRFGVGVVTRGAGTGLSGGSAAVDDCITLSTERM